METVATNIRIDKQLKEQSSQVLEGLGLSLSGAINMFLRQVILQDGIPFKVEYPKPSRSLKKAIKESEKLINDPKAKTYKNFQELLDEEQRKLNEKEKVAKILKREMENAVDLPVKLTVESGSGKTWFDAK